MEELVEIGRSAKSHGLDGGMKFKIKDEFLEDFLSAEVIFIEVKGQPVPYFIEDIIGIQMVVMLDGISTKEAAAVISKKKVLLRKSDLIPEEEKQFEIEGLKYAPYIGFNLIDVQLGSLGEIVEIVEYPQQEMAGITYKGKEILIPLNNDFIEDIKIEEKEILMSLPEGIVEVQL